MDIDLSGLGEQVREAVRFFWTTRGSQIQRQMASGTADQGARGAVTGGKQMDGFVKVLCEGPVPGERTGTAFPGLGRVLGCIVRERVRL